MRRLVHSSCAQAGTGLHTGRRARSNKGEEVVEEVLEGVWEVVGRSLWRSPEELFTTTLPSLAQHGLLRSPEELLRSS